VPLFAPISPSSPFFFFVFPLSKIISVATALPAHRIPQDKIFEFMQQAYGIEDTVEARKLRFLYRQSGIEARHSAVHDFLQNGEPDELFIAGGGVPNLEARMEAFLRYAPPLAEEAARKCMAQAALQAESITHLITVSCTGLSAPGLELMLLERLQLKSNIHRTAVNFMGCYAAVHALKMANAFAAQSPAARVLVVCTELCTLHFQSDFEEEGATAAALFGDGASAVIVAGSNATERGLDIKSFYAEVQSKGKSEMAWHLSSKGFLMTLTSYIPDLLGADIAPLLARALEEAGITREDVDLWCVHPGGKRILSAIEKSLALEHSDLEASREVLRAVGNLSSATLFFVLEQLWDKALEKRGAHLFGVAFGPGLTMESFFLQSA
jgi:predicted naringenin-chalcone synthase